MYVDKGWCTNYGLIKSYSSAVTEHMKVKKPELVSATGNYCDIHIYCLYSTRCRTVQKTHSVVRTLWTLWFGTFSVQCRKKKK